MIKPMDYRDAKWEEIRGKVHGKRLTVWQALHRVGPCTTRELAVAMRWDILSVRPRVTELCQLKFAEVLDEPGTEGRYRALGIAEAQARFAAERRARSDPQMPLGI